MNATIKRLTMLGAALLCAALAHAREIAQIQADLDSKQAARSTQVSQVEQTRTKDIAAQAAVTQAYQALAARAQEEQDAVAKLRRVEELARERAEVNPQPERNAYFQAKIARESAERTLTRRKEEQAGTAGSLTAAQGALAGIERELNALLVERRVAEWTRLRVQVNREQEVDVTGEASCETLPLPKCMEAARNDALRRAIELASAVQIESLTITENYAISKDVVRSHVTGRVLRYKEIESKLLGNTTWSYKIHATVRGELPEEPPAGWSSSMPQSFQATPSSSSPDKLANVLIGTAGAVALVFGAISANSANDHRTKMKSLSATARAGTTQSDYDRLQAQYNAEKHAYTNDVQNSNVGYTVSAIAFIWLYHRIKPTAFVGQANGSLPACCGQYLLGPPFLVIVLPGEQESKVAVSFTW